MSDVIPQKPWSCTRCGYEMDSVLSADPADTRGPEEGDVSMCLHCCALHIRHGEHWSGMTGAEWLEMPDEMKDQLTMAIWVNNAVLKNAWGGRDG